MILSFGPGFAVDLQHPPETVAEPLQVFIGRFLAPSGTVPVTPPLTISCEAASSTPSRGRLLLHEPPLRAVADDERLVFELPGARCWYEPTADRAGIGVWCADAIPVGHFVRWAFLALLFNIAPRRGWLGAHAAAVAVNGRAVVLPGSSGAGKSTIFSSAREAGLGTLSEDLIWLRPADNGFRAVAFPRRGSGFKGCRVRPVDKLPATLAPRRLHMSPPGEESGAVRRGLSTGHTRHLSSSSVARQTSGLDPSEVLLHLNAGTGVESCHVTPRLSPLRTVGRCSADLGSDCRLVGLVQAGELEPAGA